MKMIASLLAAALFLAALLAFSMTVNRVVLSGYQNLHNYMENVK